MSIERVLSRVGCVIIAAGVLAAGAGEAHAQRAERVMVTMSEGLQGGGGAVPRRSIERYAELLGFSGDQKDSALAIHEGYMASYKEVQKARSQAIEEVNRSAQDSGDPSVFGEKFPAITKEFGDKSRKLEKTLFDDLKMLCSGETQEGRWVKVERMRRRETDLRRGGIAGEGLDLIEIVQNLKLPAEAFAAVVPSLDEYETDIDGQIKARQQLRTNTPAFKPGEPPDIEALRKSIADSREAGLKIKEVNERFARRIEAVLPETHQDAFRRAVREATFPQVYRRSPIVRDIDKALTLTDLTSEQRATLTELKAMYERDSRPVNDAWAAAIADADKSDAGGGMISGPGGAQVVMRTQDEPEPLRNARKARRDLDDKAREKIRTTLSDAQQAAIKPKPGEGEAEMVDFAHDMVMIRR